MARITRVPKVHFYLDHSSKDIPYIFFIFRYQNPLRINERGKFIREDLKYAIGEKVPVKYWDVDLQMAKESIHFADGKKINKKIADIRAAIQNIYDSHIHNGMPGAISREDFKKELDYQMGFLVRPEEEQKKIPTLFEFIDTYLKDEKHKLSTFKKYNTTFVHLKNYAKERGKDLTYDSIDWSFRNDFLKYLYAPPRKMATNTTAKMLSIVKLFLKESHKLKYHVNEIFKEDGFSPKLVKTKNKVRLSLEELDTLLNLDLSGNARLERVRDLFIVGCFSGLRFSDWHKIGKDQLFNSGGVEMIRVMAEKTRKYTPIPLLPELKQILEKYEYQLPAISSQKFNQYIKEVVQIALADTTFLRIYSEAGQLKDETIQKWQKVSSHAARRSFVSNFLQLEVPPTLIMAITGHSTEKQLYAYADIEQDELVASFAKKATTALQEHRSKVKRIDKAS